MLSTFLLYGLLHSTDVREVNINILMLFAEAVDGSFMHFNAMLAGIFQPRSEL